MTEFGGLQEFLRVSNARRQGTDPDLSRLATPPFQGQARKTNKVLPRPARFCTASPVSRSRDFLRCGFNWWGPPPLVGHPDAGTVLRFAGVCLACLDIPRRFCPPRARGANDLV